MRIETKTENVENFHIVINDLHLNFPFVYEFNFPCYIFIIRTINFH